MIILIIYNSIVSLLFVMFHHLKIMISLDSSHYYRLHV